MSSKYSKLIHWAVGAAIGAAGFAGPTWAQDSGLALEEVVVTARKVEESLQDAPISVTAFTNEAITERGITDLNSLAEFSPGLSFSQAFGRQNDRPVIRGQGNVLANVQFGVESGTAYFIDGVYYNGDIQALDFDMLQRVEVIKGPQSALYGRNTYAGAINFVTRDPRGDEWGGTVKATAGKFGERRASLNVDGPIAEGILRARFGARINNYDGEYTNQATGKLVGNEQDKTFNATFVLTPTEDLTMRAFVQYRQQSDGPLALFLQGADLNNCKPGFRSAGYRGISPTTGAPTFNPASGQFTAITNGNQYFCGEIKARPDLIWLNTDAIGTTAKFPNNTFRDGTAFDGVEAKETFSSFSVEWSMPDGSTVRSLTGYRTNHDRFGTDSDHSEAFSTLPLDPFYQSAVDPVQEPLFANTNRNDRREWSTELKMTSPEEARFRYLVGAFYYKIKDQEKDLTYQSPEFGVINSNANITTIENRSVFGSIAFDLTDTLTTSVEVRRSSEEKTRQEYFDCIPSALATAFGLCRASPGTYGNKRPLLSAQFESTTPRFTLDYKYSDDVLLYAIFAKGVRPGGINGTAGAGINRPTYKEETSNNLELGIKSTLMDGRVRFNAAAYYIDSKDVQVTQALPAASGGNAVTSIAVNQAKAETLGLEVEVTAALTQYLTGTVALSYTNPEFKEGCDDFQYVLNSGGIAYVPALHAGSPLCDISGNRLPLTPETQGNVVLTYERPMSDSLSFVASGTFTHEGSKFVQVHNLAETGDTNMLGLRFGVKSDDWSITAYGRNLTDEDTIPLATRWFDLRYGGAATPAANTTGRLGRVGTGADTGSPRGFFAALRKGRTFGVEVSYSF
jgi:iron complex outermembrane receptor protein